MSAWPSETKTALLLASDGTKIYGHGFGATGHTFGEVCFNTAMSGYQEIITDPSYASQIVAFTFPHIGNVGVNSADIETSNTTKAEAARGVIVRERVSDPSNFRAQDHLSDWLAAQQIIGISGVDTRAITTRIRDHGMFNAVLVHAPDGQFDEAAMAAELKDFAGL